MSFEPLLLLLFCLTSASILFTRAFDGELGPLDPSVCTSQNITFTCRLLGPPVLNHTIGFSIKTPGRGINYKPVEEARVTALNETISQLTIYNISMEMEKFYVKCSYWKEFGDKNTALELGKISTVTVYPRPEPVRDLNCIMFNYELMNCTWDFGKDYRIHLPDITFQWRIPSYSSSWNPCPSNDSVKKAYCVWSGILGANVRNEHITIRFILKQPCGGNHENATSDFDIYTLQKVKPNPVDSLTATPVHMNSTCILVKWDTSNSGWPHPKEHKVTIYETRQNKTMVERFTTPKEKKLHNMTVCNLRPYTSYEFSVSIRSVYSEYFSDKRKAVAKTLAAKPSASPEVTDGGYRWRLQDCQRNVRRLVCTFWKPIKEEDKNGNMTGLVGVFRSKTAPLHTIRKFWTEYLTYGCARLMCNTSYTFSIIARNNIGESEETSKLEILSGTLGLRRPRFVVESADNSVFVSWSYHDTQHARGFTVAWCRNKNGNCENKSVVNWERVPSNTTVVVIPIDPSNAAQDFLYGVSVLSDQGNSGFDWQDCVYLKHAKPSQEPQNVIVTKGPDDNTLIVTWDKSVCKSDQPYVDKYNIQYTNLKNGNNKSVDVTALAEARLVLTNLEEDVPHVITIKAVTKDGQSGPASKQQIGIPENRSLKPGAGAGIAIAVLVCVIFAAIGCFCAIRQCKNKAKKVIKEAGNITIPDDTGLDFNPPIERRESFDSGYDMTQASDTTCNPLVSRTSAFVSHDDYHCLTEWKSAIHGFSSNNDYFVSIKDTKMLSVELKNYSDRLNSIIEIPKPLAFIQESESETSCKENDNTRSIDEKRFDIATVREESTENYESSKSPLDTPSSSRKSHRTEVKINMQNDGNQLNAEQIVQTFNVVELLTEIPYAQDDAGNQNSDTNTIENMADRLSVLSTASVNSNSLPEHPSNGNLDYVTPSQMFTEPLISSQKSYHIPEISTNRKNSDAWSPESGASVSVSSRKAGGKVSQSFDGYVTSVVNPSSGVPKSGTNFHVPITQRPCEVSSTANVVEEKSTEVSTVKQFVFEVRTDQECIPKMSLCNTHLNADQSEKHSTSTDIQGKTPQSTIKCSGYSDIDVAKADGSHSGSTINETGLGQASCMHDNTCFTPGIGPQSGAAQTRSSHSYSPCANNNGGYVSNIEVEKRVPFRAAGSYIPHCAVQNMSDKMDENDSKESFSNFNKFEVNRTFAIPAKDYRTNSCNDEQPHKDNSEDNLQSINIYSFNNQSPRQFVFSTPDEYFLPRQDDIQPAVIDGSQGYVDEKSVLNKSVTTEYQNDGYVDHTFMKKINGQVKCS